MTRPSLFCSSYYTVPAMVPGFLAQPRALTALLCSVAALYASGAMAQNQGVVLSDIRIEGLERIEPGTVFATIPLRVGDTFTEEKGAETVRALFAHGSFEDVRLSMDKDVLLLKVVERPSLGPISYEGFKEFGTEQLEAVVRDSGVAEGKPYNKGFVEHAEQQIKGMYVERGFYDTNLQTQALPVVDKKQVNLKFKMTERFVAKIRSIRILGSKAYGESALLSEINLRPSGVMTWYSKNDRYAAPKLKADLDELTRFYTRRGYLDFKILSSNVKVSDDKRDVDIEVQVSEGPQYRVRSVQLAGNYLGQEAIFQNLVQTIQPGTIYNSDLMGDAVQKLTEQFGRYGFAFAKIEPLSKPDSATGQVDLVLRADPGERAYVRQIHIRGNRRTRDEVIRREMRQYESSWFNGDKVQLSRERINRLGYFNDVAIAVEEVEGKPDQADLVVNVQEAASGNMSLTAGYSSDEKFSIGGGIKQDNFLGTGNYLGFDFNTGDYNRTLSLSSVDPYFTKEGVSRSFDIGYRTARPTDTQGTGYRVVTKNIGTRFGIPLSESDTVYVGAGIENIVIDPSDDMPAAYQVYNRDFGRSSYAYPLTLSWARDSRDSTLAPTQGRYYRLGTEISPGREAKYWRIDANYQQYYPVNKKITFGFNTEVGVGKGMKGRPFPVFKNYQIGGIGSVRGFESGTAGPVDENGAYLGGPKKLVLNTELLFPFPGVGNDKSMRLFTFADVGASFASQEKISTDKLRSSIGAGISWVSPIGPLRFSWAKPIRKLEGDQVQKFQFQIGTTF